MNTTKIHLVICIQKFTLVVFYTEEDFWQFRVISPGGEVFGESKTFYTSLAAQKAAREWIGQGT
jgi:hypothetical protein